MYLDNERNVKMRKKRKNLIVLFVFLIAGVGGGCVESGNSLFSKPRVHTTTKSETMSDSEDETADEIPVDVAEILERTAKFPPARDPISPAVSIRWTDDAVGNAKKTVDVVSLSLSNHLVSTRNRPLRRSSDRGFENRSWQRPAPGKGRDNTDHRERGSSDSER